MPACLANCPIAADVFLWNSWCNLYLPVFSIKKNLLGLAFFSTLRVGFEPWILTPKSLDLTFTPWRHTSVVFCFCIQIFLIRILLLLNIIDYIYGIIDAPGSCTRASGLLRKVFWALRFFSMLPMGMEPWSLSPKSLVLTFTLWRHTCKLVREKLSLIYIICIQANLHKWTGSSPRRGGQTGVRSFIGTWLKAVKVCHFNAIWNKLKIHLCA